MTITTGGGYYRINCGNDRVVECQGYCLFTVQVPDIIIRQPKLPPSLQVVGEFANMVYDIMVGDFEFLKDKPPQKEDVYWKCVPVIMSSCYYKQHDIFFLNAKDKELISKALEYRNSDSMYCYERMCRTFYHYYVTVSRFDLELVNKLQEVMLSPYRDEMVFDVEDINRLIG